MTEKMTFKFTEEEAKTIKLALCVAAETLKREEKIRECEELYGLFFRRLHERKISKN